MLTEQEQNTIKTYDAIAKGWVGTLRDDFWLEEYKKFADYLPSGKILDIGCGAGRDSVWFTQNGYEFTGFDASENMVRLAKEKNPKAQFLQADFYSFNFPPALFDGFWCACSLIHVPKSKVGDVLLRVKTALKQGAIGFIAVKEGKGERDMEWQNSGHIRHFIYYQDEELRSILEKSGFQILEQHRRTPKDEGQDGTFLVYYLKTL